MRAKPPVTPPARSATVRQALVHVLREAGRPLSAVELSAAVGVPERDVFEHLEHVRRSLGAGFSMTPAACRACGFVFRERSRVSRPGRCPACRSERVSPPLFEVKG